MLGTPPPSPTPSAAPAASLGPWQRVDDPTFAEAESFYPAVWSGSNFILPGVLRGGGAVAFWTSSDGMLWSMRPERTAGYLSDYAFDGAGAGLAVGFLESGALVWRSPDGLTWDEAPNQPALQPAPDAIAIRLLRVARGVAGYVAVGDVDWRAGIDGAASTVLRSDDGSWWTEVPSAVFDGANLVGVASAGGRLVVAGTVGAYTTAGRVGVWTSDDGSAWTESPMSGSSTSGIHGGPAGVIVVATDGGSGMASPGPNDAALGWWTEDGTSWTEVVDLRVVPGTMQGVSWGFIAATEACPSGLLALHKQSPWRCLSSAGPPPVSSGVAPAHLGSFAASDEAIVTSVAPASGQPEVWFARWTR